MYFMALLCLCFVPGGSLVLLMQSWGLQRLVIFNLPSIVSTKVLIIKDLTTLRIGLFRKHLTPHPTTKGLVRVSNPGSLLLGPTLYRVCYLAPHSLPLCPSGLRCSRCWVIVSLRLFGVYPILFVPPLSTARRSFWMIVSLVLEIVSDPPCSHG